MTQINYDNSELDPSRDSGLMIGLENQLRSEFNNWWRTKKWWINILIWTVLINGMVLLILTTLPAEQANLDTALQIFTLFSWMGTSVGIIIMMQDSVVGEKISGTAEWVLSKPVARSSFITAKLIANGVSAFVTMNVIPNLLVFFVLRSWEFDITFGNFVIGSILLYLNLMFFLTLTILCGSLFGSRAPVIGIPIAFLFGQQFVSAIGTTIYYILPYNIANLVAVGNPPVPHDALVITAVKGGEIWSFLPVIATIVFSIIFVVVAILRFEREEF